MNIVVNLEEGAERAPADGDTWHEAGEQSWGRPGDGRDLVVESEFEFGSRVGIWRLLDVLNDYDMPFSVFASGLALERNPLVAKALTERAADMIGHGYRWVGHADLDRGQEVEQIERATAAISAVTGERVMGWSSRPPKSESTREILAELGFLYDCDSSNDDLPFFDHVRERPFLVVPYRADCSDTGFWQGVFSTAQDYSDYACDAFDTLLAESATSGQMMTIGLHGRIMGRPSRISALRQFLDHVRRHDDIWATRRNEIATFWADRFAPENTWNWNDTA